jgi:triacylglycerol lipase
LDLSDALLMARAAELAYQQAAVIEQTVTAKWGFPHFRFFDVDATQCFVAANDESILVTFRGTEPDAIEDWMADLDFDLVSGPFQGRVHAGFYDALSDVWYLLDREVSRLQAQRRRQLWVTGHSLGAALATLAAALWYEADHPLSGLYAFGQPRTGDREFARNFDFALKPIAFRVVNNHDIVTRTPPRSLGYRHQGTFVYFNDSGELVDDFGWWQRFLMGWQGTIETILDWGTEGVADHSMTIYRQRIEEALKRPSQSEEGPTRLRISDGGQPEPPTLIKPRRRAA